MYWSPRSINLLFSFLLTGCLFGWQNTSAQSEFRFLNFNVEDGLSQNTVTCLHQDADGYLWLGTQDGLNRYDGRHFHVYRSNPNSLSDAYIRCIAEDSKGRLWVGTRHGLNRVSTSDHRVQRFFASAEAARGYHQDVQAIVEIDAQTMAYLSLDQLAFFNPDADNHASATRISGVGSGDIFPCENGVWLDNGEHLLRISTSGTVDTLARHDKPLHVDDLRVIDNRYWIAHSEGIVRISADGTAVDLLEGEYCSSVHAVDGGRIWVTTRTGIWDVTTIPFQLTLYMAPEMDVAELELNDLLVDQDNNLWLASTRQGFWFRQSGVDRFQVLPGNGIGKIQLPDPVVWSFAQAGNRLFAGTTKGLVVLERVQSSSPGNSFEQNYSYRDLLLPGTHISSLVVEKDILWIGTTHAKGLYRLDLNDGKMDVVEQETLPSNHIFHLEKTRDRGLAVATIKGGCLFDTKSERGVQLMPTEMSPQASGNYLIHAREDSNRNIWFTSASGLYRWDEKGGLTVFLNDPDNSNSLSYNITTAVTEVDNQLWVANLKNGIDRYDPRDNSFEHFGQEQGLINGVVYGILVDSRGYIWTSHNEGISRLDTATRQFVNFGIEDGLIGLEHGQNSFYAAEGIFYFGGVNGLICFNPLDFIEEPRQRPIMVNNLSINYETLSGESENVDGHLNQPQRLQLFPGDRALSFELNTVDFAQFNLTYQYMLEGFDPHWITKPAHAPLVSYTSLPYGKYRFKSRYRMRDGNWSSEVLSFPVIVLPPYWRTWWFIALTFLLLIGLFVVVVRYFSQRKLKERLRQIEVSQKIQKERERISMDLHDNVGAQITHVITSLDTLALKISMNKEPEPSEKIDELGDFARGTMQQLRDTIWAINKDAISLQEFINRINDHIQRTLMNDEHLKYHLHHEGDLSMFLNPTLTINLFRIVQEAINNVVKHASAELVYVEVKQTGGLMTVKVIDDGTGMDTSQETSGHYGLVNMHARMKEIGGTCTIESERGKGTSVHLSVELPPLK